MQLGSCDKDHTAPIKPERTSDPSQKRASLWLKVRTQFSEYTCTFDFFLSSTVNKSECVVCLSVDRVVEFGVHIASLRLLSNDFDP